MRDLFWNLLLFGPLFAAADNDVACAGPMIPIMMAMTIAAGVTTAIGQIQQGKAMEKQAKYNADAERKAAADARRLAESAVTDKNREKSLVTGASRAAVGGSGVALESATVGGVLADTAAMSKLDVLRIKSNAERQAWGLETKSASTLYAGRAAKRASYGKAGGTLLSTASSFMGQGNKHYGWGNK